MAGILQQLMQGQGQQQAPQGMPQQQQSGTGVPVGDTWRLPSGMYAPMSPSELFMRDVMSKMAGQGKAGESMDTIEEQRNRLKKALDEASK